MFVILCEIIIFVKILIFIFYYLDFVKTINFNLVLKSKGTYTYQVPNQTKKKYPKVGIYYVKQILKMKPECLKKDKIIRSRYEVEWRECVEFKKIDTQV